MSACTLCTAGECDHASIEDDSSSMSPYITEGSYHGVAVNSYHTLVDSLGSNPADLRHRAAFLLDRGDHASSLSIARPDQLVRFGHSRSILLLGVSSL